jgi:DNA-binding CsgD family transcriptional regulator
MKNYDPSLSAVLRNRMSVVKRRFLDALPFWTVAADPIDPRTVLDSREMEIFLLHGMRKTNSEIAFRLFLSIDSIDTYLLIIVKKLRIRRCDLQQAAASYSRGSGVEGNRI